MFLSSFYRLQSFASGEQHRARLAIRICFMIFDKQNAKID